MAVPASSAKPFLPERRTLPALRKAVQGCRGCDLYKCATQAVPGEGPKSGRLIFIGEQPGNDEDLAGRPFVGPAGRLFDRAMEEAGLDRKTVFVTNAVKHFKFEERGKRRLHKKPNTSEIRACHPWLEAEIAAIKPEMIVCLGATAAQSVFGSDYRVTKERGNFREHAWAKQATSTVHPSAILRAPGDQRRNEYQRFVEDLKSIAGALARR